MAFTSTGYLIPCCWCDKRRKNNEFADFLIDELHIDNIDYPQQALEHTVFQEFYKDIENGIYRKTCMRYCSTEENITNTISYETKSKHGNF